MAHYAIGDLQGCLNTLEQLLLKIHFNPDKDSLWFTGDLVNRGMQSLETLRFVKNLPGQHQVVLGNHDLHLLALIHEAHPGWQEDTMNDVLTAPDRNELIDWLIKQPLLHHDETLGFTITHAGLAPSWTLDTAKKLAREVENVLQSNQAKDFFQHMYGNLPDLWSPSLEGFDRLRCITNYFTRMRLCHPDGRLELTHKGTVTSANDNLMPWFKVPNRENANVDILFGHWAALGGVTDTPHVFALDTGCVWGYTLTAMRLEDQKRFSVPCV